MSRVLRGAWSRRGALMTLVLMTTVVVGGCVVVLGFARAAGTSALLTAPLLLIGAVAVPSIGAELAIARREEVGLARLRGIHGLRLWRFLLVEPLLALVLGTLAGLAVGALLTVATTKLWLGEAAPALSSTTIAAAAAIALVALVIVALGAAAALREPLASQVATRHRRRRATTLAAFLSVLVIVGAGVAAYRSRDTGGDPDLVVLLGPALVGLALGQVAIWLVRLAASAGTGATTNRGMSGFLATRRLARADDLVTPIRLVVAAAVVGSLALTGAGAVDGWTNSQARVEAGGPRVVETDRGVFGAWQLTRALDPEGEHLMATATVPSDFRLSDRRAYVDASRWESVVGDFYDGTALAAASRAVPGLAQDAEPPVARGERLAVAATALTKAPLDQVEDRGTTFDVGAVGVTVSVDYVTADNGANTATVRLDLPTEGSSDEASVRIPGCADGCLVTRMGVERVLANGFLVFDTSELEVLLSRATFGDLDLLGEVWVPDQQAIKASNTSRFGPPGSVPDRVLMNRPDGLAVHPLPDAELPLLLASSVEALQVLKAGDEDLATLDLGGEARDAEVLDTFDALPLVGTTGSVSHLATAAVGSDSSVPSAVSHVVAAEDTPAALLDEVEEATGSSWREVGEVREDLADAHGGAQARAYAMTALACALVALLALAAGVARHVRDYRRDIASLRVLGIGLATARRAGRTELMALTVLVVATVVAGGWLAVHFLLRGLPLVSAPVTALPVDTSPTLWPLVVPAVVGAAAVAVVGGRARAVRASTTRPSQLRELEGV